MRSAQDRTSGANSQPPLRRFELFLFLPWALGTSLLSINVIGAKLFLIYCYGWSRVYHEHLSIVRMSKTRPWLVSNGDVITDGFFIHWLISLACWLALFTCTYPFVRRLLPKDSDTPA
jgi:hypothetical protein